MGAFMLMSVALMAGLCVRAHMLTVYPFPFMLGLTASQFTYQTGPGFIGAGLPGSSQPLRPSAFWRSCSTRCACLMVVLVFAAPAAVAGMRPDPWCDQGIRALRNLAANLLHHRRRARRRLGPVASGGRHGATGPLIERPHPS